MFLNLKTKKIIFILLALLIIGKIINITEKNKIQQDKKKDFEFSTIINNYLGFKKISTEDFIKEISSLYLINQDHTEKFIKDFYNSELENMYKLLTEDERLNKKFKESFKERIKESDLKIILDAKIGMEYLKYSIIGEDDEIFNYTYILGTKLDKVLLKIGSYIDLYEEKIVKNINSRKIKDTDGKKTILLAKRFIDKYIKIISKSYCDGKNFDCFGFLKELAGIKKNIELVLFSEDLLYEPSISEQVRAISNVYNYAKRMKKIYSLN